MKFKTIVITRKKIRLCFSVLLSFAICAAVAFIVAKRPVAVFKVNDDIYKEILSEGLPDNGKKSPDLKAVINAILGFDIDRGETIISEYMSVFDGTTDEILPEENRDREDSPETEENTDRHKTTDTEEDGNTSEPPFPDSARIASASGLQMSNATKYSVDLNALCAEELAFDTDTDGPQVLVMHTHTTECYDGDQANGETERNTNEEFNVIAVGNEICAVLEENGIKTIHDTTYHDYPSYQGSYTRALGTIENQLKNNPSIKIVLDVHRDAFIYPDGSKLRVACEQNGVSTAQVMIVAGTDSMGLWHNNWRENLKFAAKIQNAAGIMYPGLMRPINLRTERFNEHATMGSLILEVGSNGNTLSEAKIGGRYAARAIAAVLTAK
ncbi:MAG: stage II sporulation protein P [Oscillospiraceae bacterium]|nr:stage II sporulation protein P [Oscillospiraceae bacterium]